MDAPAQDRPRPAARYMSSAELEAVRDLLIEFRETTNSRSSYMRATEIVADLGGDNPIEAFLVCVDD